MASKPGTKLTEIPIPPGYTADQADFYRRGFRAGELGAPADVSGYPAELQLAYVTGGLAGALAAPPTADELSKAYRQARLRLIGVSYQKALTVPLIRRALDCQVNAMRKKKQHGQPAPVHQRADKGETWYASPMNSA